MSLLRLIARLDIKNATVVKGVQMEGLRVVGDPAQLAEKYAEHADEIIYQDVVASLYGRSFIPEFLERASRRVFVPIAVGGGIKSLGDVRSLLRAGADQVVINTAAIKNPALVKEIADCAGSQAVAVGIEAKKRPGALSWEAYTESGRERTGKDALAWAREVVGLGAGQIVLHSIDRDGTMKGMDLELFKALGRMRVPVVLSGGVGSTAHVIEALKAGVRAISMGSALHYGKVTFTEIGEELAKMGLAGGRSAEYGQRARA